MAAAAIVIAAASLGCNYGAIVENAGAAETLEWIQTQSIASETEDTAPNVETWEPTGTEDPTPSITFSPESTFTPEGCTDRAGFVSDITVPDGTVFEPGESFTKSWRLRNDGSCTWGDGYSLVFSSGSRMDAASSVPLAGITDPGEMIAVSVDCAAPEDEGEYEGYWMLENAEGEEFGIGSSGTSPFWVKIEVDETPSEEDPPVLDPLEPLPGEIHPIDVLGFDLTYIGNPHSCSGSTSTFVVIKILNTGTLNIESIRAQICRTAGEETQCSDYTSSRPFFTQSGNICPEGINTLGPGANAYILMEIPQGYENHNPYGAVLGYSKDNLQGVSDVKYLEITD